MLLRQRPLLPLPNPTATVTTRSVTMLRLAQLLQMRPVHPVRRQRNRKTVPTQTTALQNRCIRTHHRAIRNRIRHHCSRSRNPHRTPDRPVPLHSIIRLNSIPHHRTALQPPAAAHSRRLHRRRSSHKDHRPSLPDCIRPRSYPFRSHCRRSQASRIRSRVYSPFRCPHRRCRRTNCTRCSPVRL